jgi:hypothetical protein
MRESAGKLETTTALAPITDPWPTVTSPRMQAPTPMSTELSIVGRFAVSLRRAIPIVVLCRMWTSSPMDRALNTIPPWCHKRTRRPTFTV